jgi:hypothetical protein
MIAARPLMTAIGWAVSLEKIGALAKRLKVFDKGIEGAYRKVLSF